MANLNGQNIGTNYKGFLNLDSTINTPLDSTLRAVTDGMGTSSPFSISTAQAAIGTYTAASYASAKLIVGNYASANSEVANIGIMAVSQATLNSATAYGYAVYGHGYTNGSARSAGLVGEGKVTVTGDTGSAIGVRGYANDTHAGGFNIGLYGDATGGSSSYALYMAAGDIYSAVSQNWALPTSTTALNIGGFVNFDKTNSRLGIGTTTPTSALNFGVSSYITYNNTSSNSYIGEFGVNNTFGLQITGNNPIRFLTNSIERMRIFGNGNTSIGSSTDLGAIVGIKGSGATSATTSLLVQNSAGTTGLTVYDNGNVSVGSSANSGYQLYGNGNWFNNGSIYSPLLYLITISPSAGGSTSLYGNSNNFKIGTSATATASAVFEIDSTTKGFLPPRMTTTQKNAIGTPATGLVVYDNTLNKLAIYTGAAWETVTSL